MDLIRKIAEFFDVPAYKVVIDKTAGDCVFFHVNGPLHATHCACNPADVKNSMSINWEHYGLPESLFNEVTK